MIDPLSLIARRAYEDPEDLRSSLELRRLSSYRWFYRQRHYRQDSNSHYHHASITQLQEMTGVGTLYGYRFRLYWSWTYSNPFGGYRR